MGKTAKGESSSRLRRIRDKHRSSDGEERIADFSRASPVLFAERVSSKDHSDHFFRAR